MSLRRLFNSMAERQAGLVKSFRTLYSYVLTPTDLDKERAWSKMGKRLKRNQVWTDELVREKNPVRVDDRGRDYILSFVRGVRCYDPDKADLFPIVRPADRGDPSMIVKMATCRTCEHLGEMRGPRGGRVPFCKLHRERNRTLIVDTLASAGEKGDEIMGKR